MNENRALAQTLRNIAAVYEIMGKSFFEIAAYKRAADSVEQSTSDLRQLWKNNSLDTVPGLGKALLGYMTEYFETGKVTHFENVYKIAPKGFFELITVPSIGPKKAYELTTKLNIHSIDDLKKAINDNLIASLPRFGQKSQEQIANNLNRVVAKSHRTPIWAADSVVHDLTLWMQKDPQVQKFEALGSYRRRLNSVGDLDFAATSNDTQTAVDRFLAYPELDTVVEKGPASATITLKGSGLQLDLLVCEPDSYGSLLQHFTGSREHNIALRTLAVKKGLSLSEKGIKLKNGKIKKFDSEEKFYKYLGLQFIPPELREDTGEIELAKNNKIPTLVEQKDIKGDFHIHSNFFTTSMHDFGSSSIQELADAAKVKKYLYFGISDHPPSEKSWSKKIIITEIKTHKDTINTINEHKNYPRVLNLLEVDISPTGEIKFPNEFYRYYDAFIAGVHSVFSQTKDAMTSRVINGLSDSKVFGLSHPTGRLIDKREGYEADWDKIFDFCAQNQKVLEINASVDRLDLTEILVRQAKTKGCLFMINTDTHDLQSLDLLHYGIDVARRGGLEAKDIINTWSLPKLLKFFERFK